ncbi:hypothetical protein [Streptomyces sp. NBC_01314]|uniref:hypothetical protein n=1 Tax=Streptomyces sp. NBC_01314 TaxID=2903821 RepID=UPI0030900B2E|nr:hypothetical protein OG622_19085 [Streptomyces sp. NBC_01314]
MRTEVANRLVMTRALVSARRHPGTPDSYAWVWAFPMRDGKFRISTVEIPKLIVDEDACFGEEDIERVHVATVETVEEVDMVVRNLGVDPETLDAPWKNDFPL